MKDIIDILRQQLVLCRRLLDLAKAQKAELVKTDALAARKLATAIEPVIANINGLEKRKMDYLTEHGEDNLSSWFAKLPYSPDKKVINTLIESQEKLLQELKMTNDNNLQYLDRHTKFIDYSINVMTQTSAGVTYGTPGDNGGMPVQGKKMFDTGV
ncbi:MAG: flagellar protein FlgN [Anaerovibrio sp.]|uniref:flagellar protein FlgN n=1 Tax=Anaerovibrio sp. TaxID=1872532 RepID=UPI0025E41CFF|nr:flagellar protein FlgN [Anaerovibrio sp.]MCR5176497.1 flagellar protein FlgN [Anaerovibrio sp.]